MGPLRAGEHLVPGAGLSQPAVHLQGVGDGGGDHVAQGVGGQHGGDVVGQAAGQAVRGLEGGVREDGRGVAHQDLHFLAPRAGHQRFRAQKHLRLLRSQRLFRFERLPGQIHIHSASLPVVHDSIFGEFLAYSPLAMPPDF